MPKRTAHVFEDKWRSDDVKQQEAADFSSLLLSERVLLGLKKAGFKTPSPIQLEAIPVGRVGNDLIVQAKSGTGKTLVFTVIALDLLIEKKHPQTLILAPTREIAFQICEVIKSVSSTFKYLKCGGFIGGIPIEEDRQNILGCQIVVGTPGRIKQLIQLRILLTAHIRIFVLDEADQLLEKSFQSDIDAIFVSLPSEKQIIATSATYPKSLKKLVSKYFKPNPYVARLNVNDRALLGTKHYIQIVEVNPMPVLAYRAKMRALENVLTNVNFSQCLVFCNAVSKVEPICDDIKSWGFSSTYISSAKEQTARLKAIECLKRFKCKVLVSSDVTSRGIDAENVDLIVNIDVPNSAEVYLHRVGRAGRFGSKGLAVTFVPKDQISLFTNIQKNGNFKSYFLPDPVPGNLIDLDPGEETEFLQKESISESSDEEPILTDKKSRKSIKIVDNAGNLSNGKSSTLTRDKIAHKNSLNSKFNNVEVVSSSSLSENFPNKNVVDSATLNYDIEDLKTLDNCLKNRLAAIEEYFKCQSVNMSLESVKDEVSLEQLPVHTKGKFSFELGSSSSESKEYLEIIENSDISPKDMDISSDDKSLCFSASKDILKVIDDSEIHQKDLDSNEVIVLSAESCDSEGNSKASVDISLKEDSTEKIVDIINDLGVLESIAKVERKDLDSNEVAVLSADSCDSEGNSKASVDIRLKEDSTEKIVDIGNDLEVLESIVKDEPTVLPDMEVDALTSTAVTAKSDKLISNVESNCNLGPVGKSKRKTVESPLTSDTSTNSSQIDEVTACVINFIHNYKKKNVSALSDDKIPKLRLNFDDAKSPTEKPVLERKSLNDYYYNVFEAYMKDNITGDPIEILELIKDSPNASTAKEIVMQNSPAKENVEKYPIVETKKSAKGNDKKHSMVAAKMDLNTWSLTLSSEKLSEADSDSTDSSSECVHESTPIKAQKIRNASLDVSCDTPSFPIPVDESNNSDTSSNSEYSNKCLATLENSCKSKIQIAKSNVEDLEQNSGTSSDSESSADSEDLPETTLLERANRKMLKKIICEEHTLVERADILRKVLLDLDTANDSKESLSDIQITTAGHLPKAPQIAISKSSKIISNGKSDRQCGFLASFQAKGKSLNISNVSRFENQSNAKKSIKADYSSATGSSSGKTTKSSRKKLHQISSASETSSDDTESSSSTSLVGKGKLASNNSSYLVRRSSSEANNSLMQRRSKISSNSETSLEDSESSVSVSCASSYSVKQRRPRSNVHRRAKNTSNEYSGASFTGDNESYCQFTHQWNPRRHDNNSYFNPQGESRGSRHTHEHNNSCYLPSQHQCRTMNSHSACQSRSCATWYDLFYKQWNLIHQSSYYQ